MKQLYFVVGMLLGLAVAVFALQNPVNVQVRFLFWQAEGSLALVVIVSAVTGGLVALLLGAPELMRARWQVRNLQHQLDEMRPGLPRPAPSRSEQGERRES